MAQSGYTPILIYASGTASNTPSASNLTSTSAGAELALNYADGKLFYKDSGGVVQVLASKISASTTFSAGTTGFTPNTATSGAVTLAGTLITSNGGTGLSSYTAGDTFYYASGTTYTKLAIGSAGTIKTSTGSAPQWVASLNTTQGGTGLTSFTAGDLIYFSTGTTFTKLGIGTNGQVLTSSGTAPQWTSASSVGVTTISFGSTGLTPNTATNGAVSVAGTLATTNGGTGLTSFTAANNAIYSTSSSALTAGTLPLLAGGTGATTVSGAQTNLQVDPAGTAIAMAIALG
jgi:hypothetical protein